MRNDDTFCILVEFDYLERQFFIQLSLRTVFFYQVFRSCETFYTIRQCYNGTLIQHFDDSSFVNRTYSEYCFEYIPRIVFQLLVTQAQTTVFLVDFQNYYIDVCTNLSEFRRMFDLLSPRQVRDVDQSVNTFFDFYEYTEVSEVANFSNVLRTYRIFFFDSFPWICFQLFDTQRHLAFFAVQSQDDSFYFVAHFHEVLSRTQVL